MNKLVEGRREYERWLIEDALSCNNGRIAPAARYLGVHRATLFSAIKRLGIHRSPEIKGARMTPEFRRFLGWGEGSTGRNA